MTYLYLESSALLRIVLEGDEALGQSITRAGRPVTSTLTYLEASRAIHQKAHEGRFAYNQLDETRSRIASFTKRATVIPLSQRILDDSAVAFPVEPVRTLDAIHLASVLLWQREAGRTVVASVDKRVRANAAALGLEVLP